MDLLVLGLFLDIFPQVCLARAPPSGERDHAVVCISKQLNQLLLRLFERQGLSLLELASWRHVESAPPSTLTRRKPFFGCQNRKFEIFYGNEFGVSLLRRLKRKGRRPGLV
jgi:hypothetical protein